MEYVIPKIPTADEIDALTPEEKLSVQTNLERVMLLEAQTYQDWEAKRVERQAKFDKAYSEWKEANQSLFDDVDEAKLETQLAKDFLHGAAVAHHQLTGIKTWKAFQAAESWKPHYDPKKMLDWALYEAPGMIREKLVTLNTKAADAFVLESINENGVPKPSTEYLMTIMPAIALRTSTGKILSKELEALVADKPDDTPAEPVAQVISASVNDPIRLLTQDEIRHISAQVSVPSIPFVKPVDGTPTPVEGVPVVVLDPNDEELYLGAAALTSLRTAAMEADDNAADTGKVPF